MTAAAAGKRDDMVTMMPADLERLVVARRETLRKLMPKPEQISRPRELDVAVCPIAGERLPIGPLHLLENISPLGEIDRPAVVGIDQRQIPKLCPLIEVRHARHRRLQRD